MVRKMKNVKVNGEVIIDGKLNNYEVEVTIGDCPMEFINGNVRFRYLEEAIKTKIGKPIDKIRTFNIDEVKTSKIKATFYDKSIFDMSKKELRDMCCEFIYMNVDTNESLVNLQNSTAIEFLKRAKGYKSIEETAFYITNQKTNESYIDFEEMRNKEVEKLFIVKEQHKPNYYTKPITSKISKRDMLDKEREVEVIGGSDLEELKK